MKKDGECTTSKIEWFKEYGGDELKYFGYFSDELIKTGYNGFIKELNKLGSYSLNSDSYENKIKIIIKYFMAFKKPLP